MESNNRSEFFYEISPNLLLTLDDNAKILDCNRHTLDHFGYSKDEVVGRSCFDFIVEQDRQKAMAGLQMVKEKGMGQGTELVLIKKSGSTFYGLARGAKLIGANGGFVGYLVTIQDITKIREAIIHAEENETEARRRYEQIIKLERTKDDFLAMITHELKTPLVPMQGYVDMLLAEQFGSLNEDQKKRLEIVSSSINYLLKMVSDFLDVQKLELGELRFNKEHHNLDKIVQDAILKLRPNIDKHKIILTTDLKENLLSLCDKTRLEQVIINLVSNAINFCPENNGKIHVALRREGNDARITVKDNGVGIPKDKLDKIFVKFYQVDTSFTREHKGSGLGLSICFGVIKAHDGRIWTESKGLGMGTEMHIQLPLVN